MYEKGFSSCQDEFLLTTYLCGAIAGTQYRHHLPSLAGGSVRGQSKVPAATPPYAKFFTACYFEDASYPGMD